jgi:hypothetical protein
MKKARRKEQIDSYQDLVEKFEKRVLPLPNRAKSGYVVFHTFENFTNAVLYGGGKTPTVLAAGSAKRNPIDPLNEGIGKNIALWRAFEEVVAEPES